MVRHPFLFCFHRDSVSRVLRDVADYAGWLNDEVLKNIASCSFEVDKLWTMVKKRSTSYTFNK